jgi:hypothetical protein
MRAGLPHGIFETRRIVVENAVALEWPPRHVADLPRGIARF